MRFPRLLVILAHFATVITCIANPGIAFQADTKAVPLDRVELRQGITETTRIGLWNPLKLLTFEGQIQTLDAKNLKITVTVEGKESTKTLPSEQVQKIVPAWRSAKLADAIALFDQHKFAEFSQACEKLDSAEIPEWQQKMLLLRIIQAEVGQNRIVSAGERFKRLATLYSSPDIFYAEMPLCWTVTQADDAVKQARVWIKEKTEVEQLLGASWLLMTQDAKIARSTLLELEKSQSLVIAQLAKAQLWRTSAVPDTMEQLPT